MFRSTNSVSRVRQISQSQSNEEISAKFFSVTIFRRGRAQKFLLGKGANVTVTKHHSIVTKRPKFMRSNRRNKGPEDGQPSHDSTRLRVVAPQCPNLNLIGCAA